MKWSLKAGAFLFLSVPALFSCSEDDSGPSSSSGGGSGVGGSTGGAASGGAGTGGVGTGGVPAAGGAASGGAPSGGAASGGAPSGGAGTGGGDTGGAPSGGTSGSGGEASGGTGGGVSEDFVFSSPAWPGVVDNEDCTAQMAASCPVYPQENTNFGANVSPAMSWSGVPDGTQSFAIVLVDLSNGFTHWVMWDIPGSVTMLDAELPSGSPLADPAGAQQAGFMPSYFGSGACGNVYEHRLYALDVATLPGNLTMADAVRTELESSSAVLAQSFARMQSRDYCTP